MNFNCKLSLYYFNTDFLLKWRSILYNIQILFKNVKIFYTYEIH